MARVELITAEQAPLLVRPYYEGGDPGPIVAALAQVPELAEVALPFIAAALGRGALDPRTRELVILRTSAVARCRYCVDTHTVVARDLGLPVHEVRALRGEASADEAFRDPGERAVLAWTDAVARGGPVPDELAADLARHLRDHEIVELTLLTATTLLLNRLCTALELPTSDLTRARLQDEGFGTESCER